MEPKQPLIEFASLQTTYRQLRLKDIPREELAKMTKAVILQIIAGMLDQVASGMGQDETNRNLDAAMHTANNLSNKLIATLETNSPSYKDVPVHYELSHRLHF